MVTIVVVIAEQPDTSVTVTEYVPEFANVTLEITGFCAVDV